MKKKRTPEQREAIKWAYWNKWAGTAPAKVLRTKGITNDPWNVAEITPSKLDNTITKAV
jgi:hypothetical protein